jgi:signal peptidase I
VSKVNRRLTIAGFICAALSLVLGFLAAVPAVVIGIVLIVRGRGRTGAAVIVTGIALWAAMVVILRVVLDARAFRVPSESMLPTLEPGDRFVTTQSSSPERGDIVTFNGPVDVTLCGVERSSRSPCPRPAGPRGETVFVQRVVAVGGDRISIRDGSVYLSGERQDEPWARRGDLCGNCDLPREVRVPAGHFFTMGDNRGASADGREFGPVPADWIIGELRLRYWPPGAIGTP